MWIFTDTEYNTTATTVLLKFPDLVSKVLPNSQELWFFPRSSTLGYPCQGFDMVDGQDRRSDEPGKAQIFLN